MSGVKSQVITSVSTYLPNEASIQEADVGGDVNSDDIFSSDAETGTSLVDESEDPLGDVDFGADSGSEDPAADEGQEEDNHHDEAGPAPTPSWRRKFVKAKLQTLTARLERIARLRERHQKRRFTRKLPMPAAYEDTPRRYVLEALEDVELAMIKEDPEFMFPTREDLQEFFTGLPTEQSVGPYKRRLLSKLDEERESGKLPEVKTPTRTSPAALKKSATLVQMASVGVVAPPCLRCKLPDSEPRERVMDKVKRVKAVHQQLLDKKEEALLRHAAIRDKKNEFKCQQQLTELYRDKERRAREREMMHAETVKRQAAMKLLDERKRAEEAEYLERGVVEAQQRADQLRRCISDAALQRWQTWQEKADAAANQRARYYDQQHRRKVALMQATPKPGDTAPMSEFHFAAEKRALQKRLQQRTQERLEQEREQLHRDRLEWRKQRDDFLEETKQYMGRNQEYMFQEKAFGQLRSGRASQIPASKSLKSLTVGNANEAWRLGSVSGQLTVAGCGSAR
mmetsp:Transcript_80622/g.184707  ORF Transcript_80622/g.184707 Transcript_80622/m.184707 type:complete len:512 (-) Transcript_80622:186-1721(-)